MLLLCRESVQQARETPCHDRYEKHSEKPKLHGSSFLVASSWNPREDVARVRPVGEDVTRMQRGICIRGI